MKTDWKALRDAKDHAYFMGELLDMSPESFTFEEKRAILDEMIRSTSELENAMRDDFATKDEVTQTVIIDQLGSSGYRDRDWWYRMLVADPRHRDFPTL